MLDATRTHPTRPPPLDRSNPSLRLLRDYVKHYTAPATPSEEEEKVEAGGREGRGGGEKQYKREKKTRTHSEHVDKI